MSYRWRSNIVAIAFGQSLDVRYQPLVMIFDGNLRLFVSTYLRLSADTLDRKSLTASETSPVRVPPHRWRGYTVLPVIHCFMARHPRAS